MGTTVRHYVPICLEIQDTHWKTTTARSDSPGAQLILIKGEHIVSVSPRMSVYTGRLITTIRHEYLFHRTFESPEKCVFRSHVPCVRLRPEAVEMRSSSAPPQPNRWTPCHSLLSSLPCVEDRNTETLQTTRYTHRTDGEVVVNQGAPDQ